MINILSCIGMDLQAEVCLWTLIGLIRTIFDATLFRVNANLKQVWQMSMPEQLSTSVQRVLRTMISGVMLVQCFTVYVYLASYIVLLYPVFLEERPTLVLPWLLLAAIRKLLCELTCLALGLGTCVLVGPTRPPCIKFLIIKLISIMPAFYTWMLLFSYYHTLKLAAAFKTFPAVLPASDHDYGLELAIRRRRTKSLLGEEQLRSKIVASLYAEPTIGLEVNQNKKVALSSRMIHSTDANATDIDSYVDPLQPLSLVSKQPSDTGSNEEWLGKEVVVPRDTDRILEQFVFMMLRIGAYLDKEGIQSINTEMFDTKTHPSIRSKCDRQIPAIATDESDTPPQVDSIRGSTASYLREYPHIFMKKSVDVTRNENQGSRTRQVRHDSDVDNSTVRTRKRTVSISSTEKISIDFEEIVTHRKYKPKDNNVRRRSTPRNVSDKLNSSHSEKKKTFGNLSINEGVSHRDSLNSIISNESQTDHPSKSSNGSNYHLQKTKTD